MVMMKMQMILTQGVSVKGVTVMMVGGLGNNA